MNTLSFGVLKRFVKSEVARRALTRIAERLVGFQFSTVLSVAQRYHSSVL